MVQENKALSAKVEIGQCFSSHICSWFSWVCLPAQYGKQQVSREEKKAKVLLSSKAEAASAPFERDPV